MAAKPAAPAPTQKPVWKPKPGVTWQWQLTGAVDTSVDAQMYDIDLFMNPTAVIQKLHADQRVVICYFSAGSYEPNRPDSANLAATGLAAVLDGWPDERWVDIRSPAVRNIMKTRLDYAVKQGCDGVEPDNVDAFDNENGLGLTAQDQLDYNKFLATEAHLRGLSVGLKNTLALIPQLVGGFDWALDEECELYGECAALEPFISAGKAVFHCEYLDSEGDADDDESGDADDDDSDSDDTKAPNVYALTPAQICANKPANFSTIIKNLDLDAYRSSCN